MVARLPDVTREQIRPEDLPEFDETVRIRGSSQAAYSNLLYCPKLAALVDAMNQLFPLDSVMAAGLGTPEEKWEFQRRKGYWRRSKLMEVATLATGREINSQFVFTAHAVHGREEGVSNDTIRAIAQRTAPLGLSGDEELVVRFTQELLRDRKISDATFNGIKDRFGVQWAVELAGIICYNVMLGYLLMAFEEELPAGMSPELPL